MKSLRVFFLCSVYFFAEIIFSNYLFAQATACLATDSSGTVSLPAFCPYITVPESATIDIIDGLPPGTELKSKGGSILTGILSRTVGGSLGGEILTYTADLTLEMEGTGTLSGYTRTFAVPHLLEVHVGTRIAGQPVQSFPTDLYQMQGQLPPGDPDFDLLRITAGTGIGLPSPGHTTLTQLPGGDWNIDSFFDIEYRIDFVGASGGVFAGMSGTTMGTIRMQQGNPISLPVITSISPTAGPVGTIVTITGSGFSEIPSENVVTMGDKIPVVKSSSLNELKIIIPESASTNELVVTVNGLSSLPPHPVFTVSPTLIYIPPQIDSLQPSYVQTADIDGDGKDELVMLAKGNCCRGHVTLMKAFDDGSTERTLVTSFSYDSSDDDCDGIIVEDFDNDGHLDIAYIIIGEEGIKPGSVNFLKQLPSKPGIFAKMNKAELIEAIAKESKPGTRLMRADVNLDSFFDIIYIIEKSGGDEVVVLLNDSSNPGSFSKVRTFPTGKDIKAAKIYDRWGELIFELYSVTDNSLDIYRFNNDADDISLQLQNSIPIRETQSDRSLAIGDLDGDGAAEAVILDDDSGYVFTYRKDMMVWINSIRSSTPVGKQRELLLLDFDQDGRLDILYEEPYNDAPVSAKSFRKTTAENMYLKLKVEKNLIESPDSALSFEDINILYDDLSPLNNSIATGDLDGDGSPDLVVVGTSSSSIHPPLISQLSSNRRVAGSSIRVTGNNLSSLSDVEICTPCVTVSNFNPISETELDIVLPDEYGDKYLILTNDDGDGGFAQKITILTTPDLFVTVTLDSLIETDSKGKFLKPVKRNKGLFPNWSNFLEDVVVQGGFQPGATESDAAGGMIVGISHIQSVSPGKWKPIKDSAAVRAWVAVRGWDPKKMVGKNWSKIQKTLKNKDFEHDEIGRGLDSTGLPGAPKRKMLKGELKGLDPKKTPNQLFAELVVLKLNIASSQLGVTPSGFGELVYENNSSMFDEMTVHDIARSADSAMTYWKSLDPLYDDGSHSGINPLYEDLYETIHDINNALAGPLDTTSFQGGPLVLNGVVDLDTVSILKFPSGTFIARQLTPSGNSLDALGFDEEESDDFTDEMAVPSAVKLHKNYPNPFNPVTAIAFDLPYPSIVTLRVFNVIGQEVATLLNKEELSEGYYSHEFDAKQLSSGLYFYRMEIQELSENGQIAHKVMFTDKMLLVK